MAVPDPELWEKSAASIGSNGSTSSGDFSEIEATRLPRPSARRCPGGLPRWRSGPGSPFSPRGDQALVMGDFAHRRSGEPGAEIAQLCVLLRAMPQNRKLSSARYDTLALNFLAAATLATTRRRWPPPLTRNGRFKRAEMRVSERVSYSFYQFICKLNQCLTTLGVIMDKDDRASTEFEGAAHDLVGIDRGVINRADALNLVGDQMILLVEK